MYAFLSELYLCKSRPGSVGLPAERGRWRALVFVGFFGVIGFFGDEVKLVRPAGF